MSTLFDKYTYEYLLNDALSRVPDTIDKREGSIIYDALAPACYELANAFMEMNNIFDQTFVKTATGDYLDDKVGEFGITRIAATYATKQGTFNVAVSIGARFSAGTLIYKVTELISGTDYKLQCETAGTAGNSYTGELVPITYVSGLTSAIMTDLLIPARDKETDSELITRFFDIMRQQPEDGNISQYKTWALEYGSIGRAKVIPLWDGDNTVKVSILNTDYGIASGTLISAFQTYLDPSSAGLGNGVAPIGAKVTVSTASALTVNISISVSLQDGYGAVSGLQADIEEWFKEISYVKTGVSYYALAGVMLNNSSIKNIQSLLVNGGTSDLTLTAEQIPVLGTLTVTVI